MTREYAGWRRNYRDPRSPWRTVSTVLATVAVVGLLSRGGWLPAWLAAGAAELYVILYSALGSRRTVAVGYFYAAALLVLCCVERFWYHDALTAYVYASLALAKAGLGVLFARVPGCGGAIPRR